MVKMVDRLNPAFTATLPYLKSIDKVFCNRLAPFTSTNAEVSVVSELMIHDLDIILGMVNSKVKQIRANGERLISATYDVATAVVTFENGLETHFTASRVAERNYSIIEFFGPEKIYKVDFLHCLAFEYSLIGNDKLLLQEAYMAQSPNNMKMRKIEIMGLNAMEKESISIDDSIGVNQINLQGGNVYTKNAVASLDDDKRSIELARQIEEQMNLALN